MNAIEMLENQHRQAEALFRELEEAQPDMRSPVFAQLAQTLEMHMTLEEQVFYPAAHSVDASEVEYSFKEHADAKSILHEMSHIEAQEDRFMTRLADLRETVQLHVDEEENEFFPHCFRDMQENELLDLAADMDDLMQKILDRPTPVTKASTPRELFRRPEA